MDADRRNDTGIFRYTDVEYTPEGHTDAYRWDDFLGIAGGHVYSAMDTIDMVSTGGQYEGDEPEHAYACEIVGCCGLRDGVALFRPVSHDGADLIQIAFLRNDVDDATGAYTERFEAGSFDLPARRAGGQAVDEKSVEKHRNDVCRLATLLAGGERPAMSEGVRADMRRFLEAYESDPVDPKALKIKGVGAQQVVEVLKSVYLR